MTTPPYAELVASIRQEGAAIGAAGQSGVDAAVPTCPGWTVHDLLLHVGRIYHRAAQLISERATEKQDYPPPPPDDVDAVGYFGEALDELIDAFRDTPPDTPVWNWSDEPHVAAFWARRMAHESAIHRFDAQKAHNLAQPIDADTARDGLDELVDVLAPAVLARDGAAALPEGVLLLAATDEGDWPLQLGPDGVSRLPVAKEPDVTVRGTASALLLAAYSRMDWPALDVTGDRALLEAWSKTLTF